MEGKYVVQRTSAAYRIEILSEIIAASPKDFKTDFVKLLKSLFVLPCMIYRKKSFTRYYSSWYIFLYNFLFFSFLRKITTWMKCGYGPSNVVFTSIAGKFCSVNEIKFLTMYYNVGLLPVFLFSSANKNSYETFYDKRLTRIIKYLAFDW